MCQCGANGFGGCVPSKCLLPENINTNDNRFYRQKESKPQIEINTYGEDSIRKPVAVSEHQSIVLEPEQLVSGILEYIGEDYRREGLLETPKRYLKFFHEFLNPPKFNFTTFEKDSDEMIIVKNIPFYSLCEHHTVPFFGTGHIAYIPGDRIAGLSKLPRTLDMFARRLQNQERIGKQVAEYITEQLQPKGVAVVLTARHLCMEMRGVEKPGAETITSHLTGVFKTDLNCRQEFINLIK